MNLGRGSALHRVLNARQDQDEAEIIADAGQLDQITVATNMAGRGTDIKLGMGVSELGGLHVIATERHEAHRIDRQLVGRCGRQGDPGSYEFIVSIEDELIINYYPRFIIEWLRHRAPVNRPLSGWWGGILVSISQWSAERRYAGMRWDLLSMDEFLGNILAFSGRPE